MRVKRYFTKDLQPGRRVFETIKTEKRTVRLENARGEVIFEQNNVVVPVDFSETSTTILATKYFRGTLGTPERENSYEQVVTRISDSLYETFLAYNYGDKEEAECFRDEIEFMLAHQMMAFNSPVFFNVGVKDVPQQVSACFILDVEDDMASILNWYTEEGIIFKGGSGAGVNLSKIRSSKELLKGGGTASGPVSFMRGADASAGTIKSGGKTRRAAKMVVLDVDHPDIEEFIWCKAHEEKKIRALRDAGFDVNFDGKDTFSIQYQNANNSVRLSDAFCVSVMQDEDWHLIARTTGEVVKTVKARQLWHDIAQAAWECADPGVQFDDTINDWNTTPSAGRIDASNPCSEHMRLANSSCNLASLNLIKFYSPTESSVFDINAFTHAAAVTFLAQNVLIDLADFPTEKIAEVTKKSRDLGLGYANLGALLMSMGLSYDSDEGRSVAAAITSLLTASAYLVSSALAEKHGTFELYEPKAAVSIAHKFKKNAAQLQRDASALDIDQELYDTSLEMWLRVESTILSHGVRNAQMTVLAPTGTIGLLMGCDTTGVEPAFDLKTYKQLVGGGTLVQNIEAVNNALEILGLEEVDETLDVFKTAAGANPLSPKSHVLMMAATQNFISGAISKTVNLPNSATVEDVKDIYELAWRLGVKSIAIYRDGCKAAQPLSGSQSSSETTPTAVKGKPMATQREKLPQKRSGSVRTFRVGELQGYISTGEYDDGRLGEVFLRVSKQGSTLAGIVDAWSIAISLGLQHGVPLKSFVDKYAGMRFEPQGMTNDADVRIANSLVDYIFRRLAIDYLEADSRKELGIFTNEERIDLLETEIEEEVAQTFAEEKKISTSAHAPICYSCGSFMRPSGACHVCPSCGTTSGCS